MVMVAAALTATHRSHPFHVAIPADEDLTGFIMVEQVKPVDFRSRKAQRLGKAPTAMFEEVLSILDACIY